MSGTLYLLLSKSKKRLMLWILKWQGVTYNSCIFWHLNHEKHDLSGLISENISMSGELIVLSKIISFINISFTH